MRSLLVLFAAGVGGTLGSPTHLIVLQHGLYGNACNMVVLQDELRAAAPQQVLVHLAASNEMGFTRDGIAAGGARLASEIRDIVSHHESLESISLVGNSLGGLYVRYAAAELLDGNGAPTMAGGLTPDALVTTGAPHLGVRKYTFLPLPELLYGAGRPVAGQTAVDLLLRDAAEAGDAVQPLLVRMSDPASPFGEALRAFRRRRLCTLLHSIDAFPMLLRHAPPSCS